MDAETLERIVDAVIEANPKIVDSILGGNGGAIRGQLLPIARRNYPHLDIDSLAFHDACFTRIHS